MKAIIFGANGQDGFYLSSLLRAEGVEVVSASRKGRDFVNADIADYEAVRKLIAAHLPEYIFHFAANSTTRHDVLFENHQAISTGTLNILESVKLFSPHSKVFISGSGLQFKNTGKPISEKDPFEANDAYSVSRIQSVYAARYFRTLGLRVYVGYFFNHDSPERTERHLTKKIAEAVKAISKGSMDKLEIGNPDVKKEWGFAGDIVSAVWTLVNQDAITEAVLGTGKAYSIQEFIEICFSMIGKDWKQYVAIKPGFESPYSTLVSDPSTIFSLGWKPEKDIAQLAAMMLTD
ncbi:MAG: GDP-mannose 4,6-dehydratase [Chitinophagaceae bacterium]|nr:GDP-mannose 4,6-dehydratase [Chitinophagaceae bacterium]